MTEHDNPFSEATQRLSHTGYALASLAEQHTRRTAMRTHAEAAELERPGEEARTPERGDAADKDPQVNRRTDNSRGGSPQAPTESAALPDATDRAAAEMVASRADDDRLAAAHDAAIVNEHAEGLTHASADMADASREAALAADKTAAALAQETYPHTLTSVNAHHSRTTAQPMPPRSLQQAAVCRAAVESRALPR